MIWMLRSKPSCYVLRVDVAATSATLREQLIDVRDVTAGHRTRRIHDGSAVRMRAKETRTDFFGRATFSPRGTTAGLQWEHAAWL